MADRLVVTIPALAVVLARVAEIFAAIVWRPDRERRKNYALGSGLGTMEFEIGTARSSEPWR